MKTIIAAVLSLAVIAVATPVSFAAEADASGCGKGKVLDPDSGKCVKKPKGSGSHAG